MRVFVSLSAVLLARRIVVKTDLRAATTLRELSPMNERAAAKRSMPIIDELGDLINGRTVTKRIDYIDIVCVVCT